MHKRIKYITAIFLGVLSIWLFYAGIHSAENMIIAPFFIGMGIIMLIVALLVFGWSRNEHRELSPQEKELVTTEKRRNDHMLGLILVTILLVFAIVFIRELIK